MVNELIRRFGAEPFPQGRLHVSVTCWRSHSLTDGASPVLQRETLDREIGVRLFGRCSGALRFGVAAIGALASERLILAGMAALVFVALFTLVIEQGLAIGVDHRLAR